MERNSQTKSSNALNDNNSESIITVLCKYIGIIATALPIVYATGNFLNSFIASIYAQNCEEYYQIPKNYFSQMVPNLWSILALIPLLFIATFYVLKNDNMKTFFYCIYSFTMSFISSLAITYLIKSIFSIIHIQNQSLLLILYVITNIIYIGILIYIRKKAMDIKILVLTIATFMVTISILLISCYSLKPINNSHYEIVKTESQSYVIIAKYDSKLVVIPYSKDNEQYTFDVAHYKLILPENNSEYSYVKLSKKPIILSE